MKIQNLADTLTADPAAFTEYDTFKRDNAPYLIDEYFITETAVSDYEIRVSVLDEDQNPIVTGVVDIYDDMAEAKRQIAFVGALTTRFRDTFTDAQLRALLDSYDLFVANAQVPENYYTENFDDLRLVQQVINYVIFSGKDVEEFFAVPTHTRKNQRTDFSQNRFRKIATEIAEKFQAAS